MDFREQVREESGRQSTEYNDTLDMKMNEQGGFRCDPLSDYHVIYPNRENEEKVSILCGSTLLKSPVGNYTYCSAFKRDFNKG